MKKRRGISESAKMIRYDSSIDDWSISIQSTSLTSSTSGVSVWMYHHTSNSILREKRDVDILHNIYTDIYKDIDRYRYIYNIYVPIPYSGLHLIGVTF